MTHRRHRVVLLLFAASFVAYMDRVNFAVSVPAIRHDLGFSLHDIGLINAAWALCYGLGNVPGGYLVDRIGLRFGLALALVWWSAFTIGTPFAGGLAVWMLLRALMGVGEAPLWSCNAKAADDWVGPDERSTAYSVAGSGEFLGPALGALLSGLIATGLGWRWSFVAFGAAGIALVVPWLRTVRDTPDRDGRMDREERQAIGGPARGATAAADWAGIRAVLFSRVGAGIMLTYVTNGYVLFTFKNWVPEYMHAQFGSSLMAGAAWTSLSAGMGFVGYLVAGPANDALVRRFDRLTARRIGTVAPTLLAILALLASVPAATRHAAFATAALIGAAQLLCTVTAGAWAVSVIDLSPGRGSTGVLYGVFNGALNLMGAANGVLLAAIASRFGFPAAFASCIGFMLLFLAGMTVVLDRPGYERLLARADAARRPRPA